MKLQPVSNRIDFLVEQDIKKLLNVQITNPIADIVRDAFIVACFAGLTYNDLRKITRRNIVYFTNNKCWLMVGMETTEKIRRIPLLDIPKRIVEKYSSQWESVLFPLPKQQLFNWYLKYICEKCAIPKRVTSLSARKTFIVMAYANNIPLTEIADLLGYASLKNIVAMLDIPQEKISKDMADFRKISLKRILDYGFAGHSKQNL